VKYENKRLLVNINGYLDNWKGFDIIRYQPVMNKLSKITGKTKIY